MERESTFTTPYPLVLASASPRRRELFALLGLPFRAVATRVEEGVRKGEAPAEVVARLAWAKAKAAAAGHPTALVVGCDTVVALGEEVLGKPADAEAARAMLRRLRGRAHAVYTGVAVVGGGRRAVRVARTTVWMREYGDEEIDAYVASGDPLDKAGAYAIQHAGFRPVASWEGCYANVVGLPLCHLVRVLRSWDVHPAADVPAACQRHTGRRCRVFHSISTLHPSDETSDHPTVCRPPTG